VCCSAIFLCAVLLYFCVLFCYISVCCSAIFLAYTSIKVIEHDVSQQENLSLHIKGKAMLKNMMLTVTTINRI